jgi:hypothetical protein
MFSGDRLQQSTGEEPQFQEPLLDLRSEPQRDLQQALQRGLQWVPFLHHQYQQERKRQQLASFQATRVERETLTSLKNSPDYFVIRPYNQSVRKSEPSLCPVGNNSIFEKPPPIGRLAKSWPYLRTNF